jgi:hypothetical protein
VDGALAACLTWRVRGLARVDVLAVGCALWGVACGTSSAGAVAGDASVDVSADVSLEAGSPGREAGVADVSTVDSSGDVADAPDAGPDCGIDVAGGLLQLVSAVATAMRATGGAGSDALAVPSATARDAFAQTAYAALDGDPSAACALPPSYRLVRLTDPSAGALRVVVEVDASGQPSPALYYGTFAAPAIVHSPSRALVVEAPHPLFDTSTELQATDVFAKSGARYLLVAGTHRCADPDASACSGTTTACATSGSVPYRVSDAAHEDELPFQGLHMLLSDGDATLVFLQLHGNGEPCPTALVSDCSGDWSAIGAAGMLASSLAAGGVTIGECGAGYPTSTCDLCGTDNVQARYSAGSAEACTALGTHYGRFVHVEQQLSLRAVPDGGVGGWQPMIDAVNAVFPAQ